MPNIVVLYYDPVSKKLGELYPCANCGLSLEEIIKKDIPDKEYVTVSSDVMPKNIAYRGSWRYDFSQRRLYCDTAEAHLIHYDIWRRKRKPILEKLDIELMKASEEEKTEDIKKIKIMKKALRDVTLTPLPLWDDGDTVDTFSNKLANIEPECLYL